MGPVGVQEMMVIFLVALVLFGPKKLPELGKTIGKAITEFRRAQSELKATFETHMRELEKESEFDQGSYSQLYQRDYEPLHRIRLLLLRFRRLWRQFTIHRSKSIHSKRTRTFGRRIQRVSRMRRQSMEP